MENIIINDQRRIHESLLLKKKAWSRTLVSMYHQNCLCVPDNHEEFTISKRIIVKKDACDVFVCSVGKELPEMTSFERIR
jgi:hypothetical protein